MFTPQDVEARKCGLETTVDRLLFRDCHARPAGAGVSALSSHMCHGTTCDTDCFLKIAGCACRCSHIKGLMEEAGLAVREDVMGNIYGRWQGSDASAGGDPVGLIHAHASATCMEDRCVCSPP